MTTTNTSPCSITLVGVGGQGTILTSDLLALAAMHAGFDVKKSEIHGMSQRGGSVVSQVRYGDRVRSPIIPEGATDVLVAFERNEALRFAHLLKPGGLLLVNDTERIPVTVSSGQQPPAERLSERLAAYPGLHLVPADRIAAEVGNVRTANVVLVGALSKLLDAIPDEAWQSALRQRVPAKFLDVNLSAFSAGRAAL